VLRLFQKYREIRSKIRYRIDRVSAAFEGRVRGEFLSEAAVRRRKIGAHLVYNLIFSFLVALSLTQSEPIAQKIPVISLGDVAEFDITAPITAEIAPSRYSQSQKGEIERNVPPVFDYDDAIIEAWLRRWEKTFATVRTEFYSGKAKRLSRNNGLPEGLSQRITQLSGQTLAERPLYFLNKVRFSEGTERAFMNSGRHLLGRLISPTNLFPEFYNTGIRIRMLHRSNKETVVHDVSRIWSVEQAREFLTRIPDYTSSPSDAAPPQVTDFLASVLVPNLKYNAELTQQDIEKAMTSVRYTRLSLKRGQLIVRRGERINEEQAEILEKLRELTSRRASVKRFFLSLLLLFVFFSVLFRLNITGRAFWNLTLKDSIVFMVVTIVCFTSYKFALPYLRLFFAPMNMGFGVEYLLPISAGGLIIHLLMGKETAFTYATVTSIVLGYLLDQNFYYTVYSFAVTAAAIQSIRSCKQRTDLYRCGAWSGLIGALLVLSFSLTQSIGFHSVDWTALTITIGLAFLSGLLAAILTSSIIPLFETLLGYTTSLKLLELANFNHPLLHNLMLKAPGTYHHSVIVGSLAELAADRIRANSLLARVSSYYHDIGKMAKPLYFIENQAPNNNPHNQLQPTMSAKILFSHVKEGVRMGREHNLGGPICNIIEQHHGTTLVSYFFNKAKKAENPELDQVDESNFRYPGPKPQTREAAIVMLADACEAATRSISEPTAAKIQTMIHSIITKRFMEEQFAECDLTLKDLKIAEDCFVRTLVSLYHHRIEYPGQSQAMSKAADSHVHDVKKAQGHNP
jgi:putative nucleotidyltransferase with HDIG domain